MLRSIFGRTKAPSASYPPFALAQAQAEQWAMPSMTLPAAQAELYQRLSWVQVAVGIIARSVATAGVQVKRLEGEDEKQVVNHPFENLLQHPNPHMSRAQLLEATSAFKRISGNAYWWLNRRSQFAPPDELWLIPSQQITPIPDGKLYLAGYEYDAGTGQKLMLPVDAICHFRSFNPLSQFVGLSAIEALATVAVGDMAMQKWNTAYFDKNNAKLPGALTFAQMIPDDQWKKIQAEFKRQYGGTERNLLMLRGTGDNAVNWVTMAASQKDMEFLAGRQASKEEIFMLLGVPPGMMDKNATEANAIASKAVFSELTLWPELVAMAETITNTILPAYGENLVLAFEDPRKTDRALELQEQAEYARSHTIDEVRAKFYEDEPIGDERGKLLIAEISPGGIPGIDVPEKPAPVIMPPGAQPEEGADEDEGEPPTEPEQPDEEPDENKRVAAKADTYEYASTQVDLPPAIAAEMLRMAAAIPDRDLAADGREARPHVTILYGITDQTPDNVVRAVASFWPCMLSFGKVNLFADDGTKGFDVLYVEVESYDLERLREKILGMVPHIEGDYSVYIPHATLAYVKAGRGKKYVGMTNLDTLRAECNSIVFSAPNGTNTFISLYRGSDVSASAFVKALLDDLHAWRRKCKTAGKLAPFESSHISPGLRARIMAEASTQPDMEHVKAVFDAVIAEVKAVRVIPDGSREPLPPVPYDVEISESDLERAAALWDELMPEYAGLLEAENIAQVPNA